MPVKILVISDYRDYHTARPEGAMFIALAKKGFEVHVMTYKNQGYAIELAKAGIRIIDFHPQNKFNKHEIATIRNYLISEDIDILHLFNNKAIINGIRAAKKLKTKVVLYRGYSGNISWLDPLQYFKFLSPRVDAIMCNSVGVEELLKRQPGFKKSKAVTINKGHNVDWYTDVSALNLRKEHQIPDDALLLINVANNRRMKGIPYLLRAMSLLPASAYIHLLLAGKNMVNEVTTGIVEKHGLQNRVHFLGFRKDVLQIVAGCDAFVLPSIKGESITKSVIEAMALKVTPVISDIRGNVELVEHEKCGLVFPSKKEQALADCLMQLHGNRALCKQYGEAAYKHIQQKINDTQAAEKLAELYLKLTDNA